MSSPAAQLGGSPGGGRDDVSQVLAGQTGGGCADDPHAEREAARDLPTADRPTSGVPRASKEPCAGSGVSDSVMLGAAARARPEIRLPDFFIVGAPKCGTTSLASYLRAHPGIFMSAVKEPNYFCFDAPGLRDMYDRPETYARLFARARPDQLCGEASTAYLFSEEAVPSILAANPVAKIIVMVRNPLEMVVSHHAQKLYTLEENEPDFERAWRLSPARAKGEMVGPRCRAPKYLDYQSIGRLGEQVSRLKAVVPQDQLLVIVFDDLRADRRRVYREACRFLGVPMDERGAFAIENARRTHRSPRLARALKHLPAPIHRLKVHLRARFPAQAKAIGRAVHRLNRSAAERPALGEELRSEMIAAFQDDVALLGRLLDRDLGYWCRAE
jgi:Sulfotransferase domain